MTGCASCWPAPCSGGAWRAWGCSRARRSRAPPPVAFDLAPVARIALVQPAATPETWREALAVGEQELRRALTYGFHRPSSTEELAIFRNELDTARRGAKTRASRRARRPARRRHHRRGRVHLAGDRSAAAGRAHPRPAPGRHRPGAARLWDGREPQIFVTGPMQLADPGPRSWPPSRPAARSRWRHPPSGPTTPSPTPTSASLGRRRERRRSPTWASPRPLRQRRGALRQANAVRGGDGPRRGALWQRQDRPARRPAGPRPAGRRRRSSTVGSAGTASTRSTASWPRGRSASIWSSARAASASSPRPRRPTCRCSSTCWPPTSPTPATGRRRRGATGSASAAPMPAWRPPGRSSLRPGRACWCTVAIPVRHAAAGRCGAAHVGRVARLARPYAAARARCRSWSSETSIPPGS